MATDIHQQFEKIIKQQKVALIIPFLKNLSDQEKKELVPTIKKTGKYYTEIVNLGKNSWGSRATREQSLIIHISEFVCYKWSDFVRLGSQWVDKEYIKEILEFYLPDGFGKFIIDKFRKDSYPPFQMDYEWMMQLYQNGILELDDRLVVRLLPQFLYDSKRNENTFQVIYTRNDSKLFQYPETLSEHIWLLFKEDSNLHWSDHYINYHDPNRELLSWKQAFKNLSDNGTIDRVRLLKSTLGTTAMNFNKSSVGWFIDLFDVLSPTISEMLIIQREMMGVFNGQHSKPINTVLKYFKKICLDNGFSVSDFLSYTPLLLSNETKSIVTSTLMILEKLAGKYPDRANEICALATQSLVSNDSDIQNRTAKLIAKYGNSENDNLNEAVDAYSDMLLSDANVLLSDFLNDRDTIDIANEIEQQDKIDILSAENKVIIPETIDDLMFLASEAFDNNSPLHFDILPAALVNLNGQLSEENVARFEPALQRAYKLVIGDWRSGIGLLDHMLATFFIEYCDIIADRFSSDELRKVSHMYYEKEDENRKRQSRSTRNIYPLKHWRTSGDSPIFKPFIQKLLFVLDSIRSNSDLPVLSTPTHYPFWINPLELIERIKKWQDAGKTLKHADFQLAITRTYLKNSRDITNAIDEKLQDEPKGILQFLLDTETKPIGPFKSIANWWAASITKSPNTKYNEFNRFIYSKQDRALYTGNYDWKVGSVAYMNSRWDYEKRRTVNFTDYRKQLTINILQKKEDNRFFINIFNRIMIPKIGEQLMIYENLYFTGAWYVTFENDVKRFYSLVPNNPENLIANILDKTLKYNQFTGETSKQMYINTLESLLNENKHYGAMSHLFIGGGLICSDKTARSLAGEVWMYGVSHDIIDSGSIGEIVGKHLGVEFAPAKRLTDLMIESLLNVSNKHNSALQDLIENLLLALEGSTPRGLKKLLEIYVELLRKKIRKAPLKLKNSFKSWNSINSLSAIAKKVEFGKK